MKICEQTVEMLEKRMHFLNKILLLLLFRPKIDMIFFVVQEGWRIYKYIKLKLMNTNIALKAARKTTSERYIWVYTSGIKWMDPNSALQLWTGII